VESLFRLDHKKQDEVFTMQHTHCRDHYELYYLFSGERYYLLEDRIYRILQGDLVFIPPNMVHQTAESVGYGSQTHFGRSFKKVTGMTAVQYRKAMGRQGRSG
jgi:AraC-like DNA-binding protein